MLKRQKVLLRLYPGDDFSYSVKGSKAVRHSYVNNLSDTSVTVHVTDIPFHQIDRVYFRQRGFHNLLGYAFVAAGTGYFLIDQANQVREGNGVNLDDNVSRSSVVLIAVGLPAMLLHKKSQRMGGKYRLLTVEKGSPFFRPDLRNVDSYKPYGF